MLIIDEAHTAGMADWFQLAWQNATFNKLIWLSATPERKDNKHKRLFAIAPKLMSVTYKEALKNGWISNYTIYNVGLTLTKEEQIQYDKIDLKLTLNYLEFAKIEKDTVDNIKSNIFKLAGMYLATKNWEYIKVAKEYYKLVGQRKLLLYNAENKLLRTINYIQSNPDKKVLVFSQSQKFADDLQNSIGDTCVTIHSKLTDKQRELNLSRFRNEKTIERVISSIKALNEGIDIPELEVGICASGTSSTKDAVQQLGRVARLYRDKHALFFNLYIKGTQDLYWLKNRQWGMDHSKIKWV